MLVYTLSLSLYLEQWAKTCKKHTLFLVNASVLRVHEAYWATMINIYWLVVWNMIFTFPYILGISSSQLTNSYFQRGGENTPTRDIYILGISSSQLVRTPWFSEGWRGIPPTRYSSMQLIGGFFFMRHGFKMSMWRPGQLLEIHDFYGGLSIGMVHRRFDKSCVFSSTPCLTAEGQAIITHHKSINHQQSMNHPLIQCIIVYLCFEVKTSNRFWMCSRRVLQKFSSRTIRCVFQIWTIWAVSNTPSIVVFYAWYNIRKDINIGFPDL